MRKKRLNFIVLLLVTIVLSPLCLHTLCINLYADVINVPGDYATIKSAVEAAKSGDTIKIAEGTYQGRVNLKPSIKLEGAGQDNTIIDGMQNEHCVVMDDFCELKDLRIMNGDVDIWAKDVDGGKIENCYIESRYLGLFADNSSISLQNNHFFCTYTAIHLQNSNAFQIINNQIEGRYVGIWCEKSTKVDIIRNFITGFLVDIVVSGAKPLIANNFIVSPILSGIACLSGADAVILNNTIAGSLWYGLNLMNSSPILANNIIAYNAYGIKSEDGSIPYLTHNIVSPNYQSGYTGLAPGGTDLIGNAMLLGGGFSSDVSEYIMINEDAHWKPRSLEGHKIVSNVLGEKYQYNGPDREYWICSNTETSLTVFEDLNYNPAGMLTSSFTKPGDLYFIYIMGLQTAAEGWDTDSPAINTGFPDPSLNDSDGTRNDIGVTGGPFAGWIGNTRLPRLKALTAKQIYTQGDHFHVVVHIENIMETAKTVDLYKILHYSLGDLYIKSDGSFSAQPAYERRTLSAFYRQVDTIFDLTLPSTLPKEDYEFTARMTEPGTTNLVCPDSIINFSFRNFPHAEFTVTPSTGKRMVTAFQVDATGSTDIEDITPLLQVRWQWESGLNFSAWSTVKKTQHKYPSTGTKVIILEVRDLDGNVSSATQTVTVKE